MHELPSFASLVAATRHFPSDSSFLYGIDQESVNTRVSNSYKFATGNSKTSSLSDAKVSEDAFYKINIIKFIY